MRRGQRNGRAGVKGCMRFERGGYPRRLARCRLRAAALGSHVIPFVLLPPSFTVLGVRVPVFGLLLFVAVLVTYAVILRRGRALGAAVAERFARVLLVAGVVGAHAGGVIGDHGAAAFARPSLFLSTAGSFSSSVGLVAAAIVGGVNLRRARLDLRAWADVVAYAFPFGLFVARAGCALAHDHPGRLSSSWLAVPFPGGARLDCGLLEWAAAPLLIALAVLLGRRSLPAGRLAGLIGAAYAVVRFGLDFLRATDLPVADARLGGLTLAQWLCVPLLVGCAWLAAGIPAGTVFSLFSRRTGCHRHPP